MKTKPLHRVIHYVRWTASRSEQAGQTDGELLECYITNRDDAAFEALVHRHGPMVLGVCRQILGNEADAEDAFQVTFLVLSRKAAGIRPRGMVSNWLFGVARKPAWKARTLILKRRTKERAAHAVPGTACSDEFWRRAQVALSEELDRLPDKYRVPVILCELEGQTIQQAAQRLGWPQ